VIVREAAPADRVAMIRMGRAFLEVSGAPLPFDAAYAERAALRFIEHGDALALILEADGRARGMLAATLSAHVLAPTWIVEEAVWWIDPGARSLAAARAMLGALEAWARDRGAALIGMSALDDRPEALYRRAGYQPAERRWMKAV